MKNLIQIYLYIQIFSEDKDKDKDKMGSSRVLHSLLCLVRLVFTLYHTHEQISEYIHTSKFDTNKCLNIFKKEKLIQIFVTNIFEYSNIWIYSSHSGCIIVWSAWFGLLMKELNIRSCLQFNIGDREVVAEKFSQGISGENPYWEDNQAVPSLSDHCIKTIVRLAGQTPHTAQNFWEIFSESYSFARKKLFFWERPEKSILRCFSFKPGVSRRLTGNDRQRFLALLSLGEDIRFRHI